MNIYYHLRKIFLVLLFIFVCCLQSVMADEIDDMVRKYDDMLNNEDYPGAIAGYKELMDLYQKGSEEYERFANIFFKGGDICYDACRYIEALEFYTVAMEASDKAQNTELYNKCVLSIGNVYGLFEDYDRASFYFRKCLATAREHADYDMISKSLVSLVMASALNGNTADASNYFVQQTQYPMKELKYNRFYYMFNQGLIASSSKNCSAAVFYYDKALGYVEQYDMGPDFEFTVKSAVGKCYMNSDELDKALDVFNKYLDEVTQMKRYDLMINAYQLLYTVYKKMGNKEKEKEYFNKYHMFHDSLYNLEKFSKAGNTLLEYEDLAKNEKINRLTHQVTVQFAIIVGIMLVVGTLITMVIIIFNQKKKLNNSYRLLIEKEKALDKSAKESNILRDRYVRMIKSDDISGNESTEDNKQEGAMLKRDQKEVLLNKITAVMENSELVFSPDFSLTSLAREVGSNVKYVSYVINDTYNVNFKAFVNSYRLREACRLLKDTDEQIQNISVKVGYNSAASFIKIFKKAMGMTPAVYKRFVVDNENTQDPDDTI